jgi:hypothetical protein
MSVIIKIKQIHEYASDHLRSCFSLLPSYEAFNMRINHLSEAFRNLSDVLMSGYCPQDCDLSTSLMDSLPIITCSGKRIPSVAKEITDIQRASKVRSTKGLLLQVFGRIAAALIFLIFNY